MATAIPGPIQPDSPFENTLRQAQELLQAEDLRKASEAFADALVLSPRHIGALLGRATCLRKLRVYEEAQHVLNRALFVYPADWQLLNEQAQLHFARRGYGAALTTFERILSSYPDNEDALRGKAECLRFLRRFEEATKAIQEAVAKFPRSEAILTERARLHYSQELYDEAVEAFLQAGDEDSFFKIIGPKIERAPKAKFVEAASRRLPKNVKILNWLGQVYSNENRFDRAIEIFERVRALDPDNEVATLNRIGNFRQRKAFEEASAAVKEAATKFPKNPKFLMEHAWLYRDQELYDQAVEVFVDAGDETSLLEFLDIEDRATAKLIEVAARRFPKSAMVMNRVGQFYSDQEQHERAIEACNRVLARDPGNEVALKLKITSLRRMRRFDETDTAITEALQRFPGDQEILTERARLHYDQKQFEEAVKFFVEAQNLDELIQVMRSLRGNKRFKDCERLIRAALAQLPDNIEIAKEEGWLLSGQRRYDKATKAFERVLRVHPGDEDALVEQCQSLRLQRLFDTAESAIEEALDQRPVSTDLLKQRGWLYYDQALYDRAAQAFDGAIHADPDAPAPDIEAIQWKIRALRHKPDLDDAEKVCVEALSRNPDDARLCFERGQIFYDRNQLQNADEFYAKAIENDTEYLEAYFARVDVLKLLNRGREALDIMEQLEADRPDDLRVKNQVGWFYLGRNDLIRAKREFESILAIDTDLTTGINSMGALHFNQGHYSEAENLFRRALQLDPHDYSLHCNLAWALVKQAQAIPKTVRPAAYTWLENIRQATGGMAPPEQRGSDAYLLEAEEHCRTALHLYRKFANAYTCLGIIAFQRGRLIESEDFFQRSILLDPKDAESHVNLGALYSQMGRYGDAKKFLTKAQELDRTNAKASLELGSLYLQTEQIKEAIQSFREAQAADPNIEDAPRGLAIALMKAGDFSEAGQVLKRAIRSLEHSKRWRLHLTLCQLLTHLGDKSSDSELYVEALKESSMAISLKPDAASAYFHAGIVHGKLEDYGRALKDFRECLEKDPDYLDAAQNARKVQSLILRERVRTRGGIYAGITLGIICFGLLITAWVLYFKTSKISEVMINTISPILLGLVFVAFLLPWLSRLKLPGFEAELTQREQKISTGPLGLVEFSSSSVSSGPQ